MRIVWLAVVVLLLPMAASAGRRPYLIGYDVPAVPDGDVEIETWMDFISTTPPADKWRWWIGPRWAPHEKIEFAIFTIIQQENDQTTSTTELWAEQLDLRWRVFSHKRAGALTLQLNARIAVVHDLPHQISPQVGWASRFGRFGFTAQVGYAAGFAGLPGANYHFIVWNAGAAVDVVKGQIAAPFQLGVEAFGQGVIVGRNDLTGSPDSTVNLGPTLSFAKGRLWLTAGALFGLTPASPFVFARGVIGVAL